MNVRNLVLVALVGVISAGSVFAQPRQHTIMGMQYRGVSPTQQARLECGTFTIPSTGGTIISAGSSNAGFWIARAPNPTNVYLSFDSDASARGTRLPQGSYMVCPNLPPNVGQWRVQLDVLW